MINPPAIRLLRKIKSISLAKLTAFVLCGVVALQMAVLVQYGTFHPPAKYPMPVVIGIVSGALIAILLHLVQVERRETKSAFANKEELLEALALSESRLLLATGQSHIWDWDIATNELYLSPGFASALGYTAEELRSAMDGTIVSLLHPDDVQDCLARLKAHIKNPSKGFLSEQRYRTKSGDYRWFLSFGHSKVDETGSATRFAGTMTDISERVHLETKLRQAQKLEAIGKLTGGVAHDFNNLLAVIMGNLELLRDDVSHPDHMQMINAGLAATRRGADLTQSMLAFARKAHLEPKVMNLNDVVRHAKTWMRSGLPEAVNVELSLLAGLWQVRLDATTLENAILNLLFNARDAMDARGNLTIETANVEVDQTVVDARNQELVPGRYVMLAISDTGTGITEEVLKDIFEPFYSTKGPGKGTGMGLSMVEGFVKQSGGTVLVYSEPGQGTTFKVYFPAIIDPVELATTARAESTIPSGNRSHVLLAEDEDAVRAVLVATLKNAGYHVTAVASGDEAIQICPATPAFDLLITDMVMPGTLQGPALAKAIRKINPDLPIIFMSGYASDATNNGNGLRPHEIRLMKPVPKNVLLTAIIEATGQRGTTPKPPRG